MIITLCFLITQEDVEKITNIIWDLLEPLLFASIGTEIDLFIIKSSLIISATILLIMTLIVSDKNVLCLKILVIMHLIII